MSAEVSAAGASTRWRPVVLTFVGVVAVATALDTALDAQTVVRRGAAVVTVASSAGVPEAASPSTPASATLASSSGAAAPDAAPSTLAMETCSAASGSE